MLVYTHNMPGRIISETHYDLPPREGVWVIWEQRLKEDFSPFVPFEYWTKWTYYFQNKRISFKKYSHEFLSFQVIERSLADWSRPEHHGCTGRSYPVLRSQQKRVNVWGTITWKFQRSCFILFGAVCSFLVTVHAHSELSLLLKRQITKRLLER